MGVSSVAAQPAALDYLAPAGCPDAETFERELSAQFADKALSTPSGRGLRIRIDQGESGSYVGRVEFLLQPGAYSQRELTAQTCEELTRALALVVAVVWSPEAREEMPAGGTPRSEEVAASSAEKQTTAGAAALARRKGGEEEQSTGVVREPFEGRWLARAWLGLGLDSAALPSASLLPRLGLAAERSVAPRVSLSLGLSAALPSSERARTNGVAGNFKFAALRAEGCGAFSLQARAQLEACGALELGRLAGESSVSPRASQAVTWIAPGILGRARVRVAGPFWLQGGAGVLWPVRRPVFYVDEPDATQLPLHEVSSSGLTAELCAGVRLP